MTIQRKQKKNNTKNVVEILGKAHENLLKLLWWNFNKY